MSFQLSAEQLKRLDESINRILSRSLKLLDNLISTNSVSPSFCGVKCSEVIGGATVRCRMTDSFLSDFGYRTDVASPDPGRQDILSWRDGTGSGASLFVNWHYDTVAPLKIEEWKTGDPWKPLCENHKVHGLGATGVKGEHAAAERGSLFPAAGHP
jgi:acetylornithine deacetylase/succinyl-diaminopimelate desuccinylase-like protein